MEGQIVGGRYEVVRELGRGGMGAVYEARHTGTGRRVAVKVITADLAKAPGLVQRFEVEARAGGGIDSQYIAQVLDTGSEGDAPYIVMEYLVGEDLFQLVSRMSPLPVDLSLRIIAQACLGLEKAHQAKIIHRDIKPANIYLNEREGDEIGVKILDFGVAKIRAEEGQNITSLTRTGSLLGSPLYMSPEQARGDKSIDHRSDIWSLGVVLYEQLCGVTPFHEIEALGSLIIAICGETPPTIQQRAQWVPPQVATILHKALAQRPQDRFSSMLEMYRAIKAVLPNGTITIEKSMIVPLTSADRAYVAPPMSSTEPVLSNSAPGLHEDKRTPEKRVVIPSIYPPDSSSEDTAQVDIAVDSTLRAAAPRTKTRPQGTQGAYAGDPNLGLGTMRSAPPTPLPGDKLVTIDGQERARTTGGITSEPGRSSSPRSFIPIVAGAVAIAGVAVFAGIRIGGSSGAEAVHAVGATSGATVTSTPSDHPSVAVTAAPTVSPTVTPADAPSTAPTAVVAASASATVTASGAPPGRTGKLPVKPNATATGTTTSVGGRIIRTDLP